MRLKNDLGYGQLLNPNQSFNLVMMQGGIILNKFFDIFTTLAKDFIAFHSLSQSPLTLRVEDLILTIQSSSRNLYHS